MKDSWFVEVKTSTGKALAIGTDYVSRSADLTERDNELIREAGKSLLAFVGEPPNNTVEDRCACKCPQGSLCEFFNEFEQCQYGEI